MRLTHPERFAAWILARLRGFPPGAVGGSWARAWKLAARIYRDRALNTMQGLRMVQQDIRTLQQALDEKDDKRPLSGGELDDYIVGLRQRIESLWMHSIDLGRERDDWRSRVEQAEAEAAALREALEFLVNNRLIHVFLREDAEIAPRALRSDAGAALLSELAAARAYMEAQDPEAPLLPAEQMIALWKAWKKERKT